MPIKALEQYTIDKIAAGEVIARPVNAIKELLENSLDAGGDVIEVTVLGGGLKQIKVKDNGSGIDINDLPLLCDRYATSKLYQFDDLYHLTTFGFRGEALASISNASHMTVYSKTKDSNCGFQATFEQGKLVNKPILRASVNGTTMVVEDLFHNSPTRLKSMKSAQEYKRIVDCVEQYAIHYFNTSFILKTNDIQFQVKKEQNRVERLYSIYRCQCKTISYKESEWEFELNYSLEEQKETSSKFILFVNGRLVENKNIKGKIYNAFYPYTKASKPLLVHLSLKIRNTSYIDVNIHPSKNEVALLYEHTYVQTICQCLTDELLPSLHSPSSPSPSSSPPSSSSSNPIQKRMKKNIEIPKMKTLDFYFKNKKKPHISNHQPKEDISVVPQMEQFSYSNTGQLVVETDQPVHKHQKKSHTKKKDMASIISQLEQEVIADKVKETSSLFENQEYIGYVNDVLLISQYNNSFYLMNHNVLSEEFFYQFILKQYGKYGRLLLNPPISIKNCSELLGVNDLTGTISEESQAFLEAHFQMTISNGLLTSLPMFIYGYVPALDKIPRFLYQIMITVPWSNEMQCFKHILRLIAALYSTTTKAQFEQIQHLLPMMHVPFYIVSQDYFLELDIPVSFSG